MSSGRTAKRRLIAAKAAFVLLVAFAAGLVSAGVVAGAGPLAILSTDTPTGSEPTSTDPAETQPSETTATETTSSETTSTETSTEASTETSTETETPTETTTETSPSWPEPTEPYLVKFAAGTSLEAQEQVLASAGARSESYIRPLRIHAVLLPGGDSLQASLDVLTGNPSVVRVEEDRTRKVGGTPNDTGYAAQWALPTIGWDEVFGNVSPSGSATVAILDTGIDGSHPDLDGVVVPGTSILDGSNGLSDPNGHGTAMAGIVAAETGNGAGVAGVAYAGVRVMPVTVLGEDGTGQDSDIIEGVVYAAEAGADVILMAFSNPGYSELLQEAIDYAWGEGAVLVAAVGNDGSSAVTFPAGDRGVIGVSNTDESDALDSSSNYGQAVFLGAPGTSIATTQRGGGYASITGTSAAAAHVAGAAALIKAASGASNGVIVGRLARNAEAVGTREQTGNGRLNLARAVADTSTESVTPAGADPVGSGGPYVGPYVAAAADEISGLVVNDSDGDGVHDAGEAGLSGASVELFRDVDDDGVFEPSPGADGSPLETDITPSTGVFSFTNSSYFNNNTRYFVRRTNPSGFTSTAAVACTISGGGGSQSSTASGHDLLVVRFGTGNPNCKNGKFLARAATGSVELRKVWVGTAGNVTLKIGTAAGGSQVDSETLTGTGGTTGANSVTAGTYYLSETFNAPTDANDYDAALACFNDNGAGGGTANNGVKDGGEPTVTPGASNSVAVASGDDIVCTFTNTRRGTVELRKVWVGTAGNVTLKIGTAAGGSQVDSETLTGTGGTTGANSV
ncbi:MAG TPA: S8 family serine peptidase, partial [Gaiellaceae bacterium]|nr:S8 family serine peptidase [Gaiellaceae bacterium]